jgi:amino-acid N-acetyltransferase
MGYIIGAASADQKLAIIDLLQASNLPVQDLPATLENFLVATLDGVVVGVAGLELYGRYGLLRSVAVENLYRNKNIAAALLSAMEETATQKGLNALYLLTETAMAYFEKKGYIAVGREHVPGVLKSSSEFSHVCPVSAVVMQKQLSA